MRNERRHDLDIEHLCTANQTSLWFVAMHYIKKSVNEREKILSNAISAILVFL